MTTPILSATETLTVAPVAPVTRAWSAEQAAFFAAVETGAGHIVLKAPAGSGKTTTIMEAVTRLADGNREILVVSFGREIKAEIAARVEKARLPGVYVSTLHSYGRRAVARAFPRARCDEGKTTTIADRLFGHEKGHKYIRALLAKGVEIAKNNLVSTFAQIDAALDAQGVELPEYVVRADFVRKVVTLVAASMEETATFDMTDMIWLPVVLGLPCPSYDMTFIDETQDLNACQLELALRAAGDTGRVIAVGDERQAIYGFRGAGGKASIARIVDGLKADVLRMTITYRCARSIVDVAAETVDHFVAAPGAPEGEVIRGEWNEIRPEVKGGDLVVSRSNAPLIREVMAMVASGRKACYLGRDAGKDLAKYAAKAKATTIADLVDWAEEQCAKDCARAEAKGIDSRRIVDRCDTVLALAQGAADVAEFFARIESFFVAERGEDTIAFSTTHQAKGLEADRVFVFADTYSPGRSEEDDNLWYVAVTRAKTSLYLCDGTVAKREGGRW
jgi:superfamily I DNA/RNA helicase